MLIEKNAEEVELEFDVSSCSVPVLRLIMPFMSLQVEDFRQEMAVALKSYDKYIVCVEKTPEEFLKSLQSLMGKAIQVFENRAAGLRHGIALDRHVTIILSETDGPRPFCSIYFNLHNPHRKTGTAKTP